MTYNLMISVLVLAALKYSCFANSEEIQTLNTAHAPSCHKKREILSDSWGIISDGDGNYLENSYCEWLIEGNSGYKIIVFLYYVIHC